MKKKIFNLFLSIGKYDEPLVIKKQVIRLNQPCMYKSTYKYYLKVFFTKYPITGKEYAMLQGLLNKIFKGDN